MSIAATDFARSHDEQQQSQAKDDNNNHKHESGMSVDDATELARIRRGRYQGEPVGGVVEPVR